MKIPEKMHTLSELAKLLNREVCYVSGLQTRLDLPKVAGAGYSAAYLAFLRNVVFLRMLNISEARLAEILILEKKLLELMHLDSIGTATWFLDECGAVTHPNRRLLLTNFDIGMDLSAGGHQLGLNFATTAQELFPGRDMGEDSLRVLGDYRKLHKEVQAKVLAEMPLLAKGIAWGKRMIRASKSLLPSE